MTPGMKMMLLDKTRKSGDMDGRDYRYGMDEQPMNRGYKRNSNGRFAPHNSGTEIENRFRDRRGREHYDPERFSPVRSGYDGGSMEYDGGRMTDRMPPVYDMEPESRYNGPRYREDGYRMNEDGGRMVGFEGGYAMQMHGAGGVQSRMMMGHAESMDQSSKHLDQMTAKKWVEAMGENFSMEETMEALKKRKCKCEPLEFWVIVNAMKSDYPKLAAKYGVDHIDFYADMAVEWLEDRDAKPGKAMNYYRNVVKHE